MGRSALMIGAALVVMISMACGGASSPMSPSSTMPGMMDAAGMGNAGGTAAADDGTGMPIGLTGVIRRLDMHGRVFVLETRTGSHTVRADDRTEVWNHGTRMRFSSLGVGHVVSVRGYHHGEYILARTIGMN